MPYRYPMPAMQVRSYMQQQRPQRDPYAMDAMRAQAPGGETRAQQPGAFEDQYRRATPGTADPREEARRAMVRQMAMRRRPAVMPQQAPGMYYGGRANPVNPAALYRRGGY